LLMRGKGKKKGQIILQGRASLKAEKKKKGEMGRNADL